MQGRGSRSAGGDGTAAETSLLQIKTNFESNLNLALRDYNVTADRHSEAVDTIQRTVSAPGWRLDGGGWVRSPRPGASPVTPCGIGVPVVVLGVLLYPGLLRLGG